MLFKDLRRLPDIQGMVEVHCFGSADTDRAPLNLEMPAFALQFTTLSDSKIASGSAKRTPQLARPWTHLE
jgi:hypothetical protein